MEVIYCDNHARTTFNLLGYSLDQLPRRSLILCGFLDANVSSGSVMLKDLSGEIVCEVSLRLIDHS